MKAEEWLIDFAEELKSKLRTSWTPATIDYVVQRLKGANLTKEQSNFVWAYFAANGYDRRTGNFLVCDSDNSEFLKVVAMVQAKVGSK